MNRDGTAVGGLPRSEQVVVTAEAEIPVTAVAAFRAPIGVVFDYIAAEDTPPKMMLGYGPVPGVAGGEVHEGPWDPPGPTAPCTSMAAAPPEITALRGRNTSLYRV
jgi:hypothetical protein